MRYEKEETTVEAERIQKGIVPLCRSITLHWGGLLHSTPPPSSFIPSPILSPGLGARYAWENLPHVPALDLLGRPAGENAMRRREMLGATGAAMLGLGALPLRWVAAEEKKQKVLYFTRSVEFEHSVVKRDGDRLSFSEKILTELGRQHGVEVVCTKDGRVFDGDLAQYDAICFYTCHDQSLPSIDKSPPMSAEGMKKLLAAVEAGKPFVGIHPSCYVGRRPAGAKLPPFLAMVGGEFVSHGAQQKSTMKVVSPKFPGCEELGESFTMVEEWYALNHFAKDLHVILLEDNTGMQGAMYQRPPFPSTWARMHGKGRVFFTALGHREDVWESDIFRKILVGGFSWALGRVPFDPTPNLEKVAPKAEQLTNS
jgi:type 1 glutamine amidotransferase